MNGVIGLHITIVSVGKIKEAYLKDGVAEYTKRLSHYCSLSIKEVSDESAPDNLSEAEIKRVKEREGTRILKHVTEGMYIIVLDSGGVMLTSEAFSSKLQELSLEGKSNLCIIIGGSLGISVNVLKRADFTLSFSKMILPHQLIRLVLLEQIYRAYRIARNEPYHK